MSRSPPALQLESEWDVRDFHLARQADTANTVTWEITGTAHADQWSYDAGEATVRRSLGAAAPADPDCSSA